MIEVTNNAPKRDSVLFVRIQEVNKDYLAKKAKEAGFKDTATYLDALFSKLRESEPTKTRKLEKGK